MRTGHFWAMRCPPTATWSHGQGWASPTGLRASIGCCFCPESETRKRLQDSMFCSVRSIRVGKQPIGRWPRLVQACLRWHQFKLNDSRLTREHACDCTPDDKTGGRAERCLRHDSTGKRLCNPLNHHASFKHSKPGTE